MTLVDNLRTWAGREVGRVFACKELTSLVIRTDGTDGYLCSFCISETQLQIASKMAPGLTRRCEGWRIRGENGETYPVQGVSVNIVGLFEREYGEEVRRQAAALGQLARELTINQSFGVCLVTYRNERYRVFGLGYGEHFVAGDKIILADLPCEQVADRFEAERPRRQDVIAFDNALKAQIENAIQNFNPKRYDY